MTNLDDLDAMAAPPDFPGRPLDLAPAPAAGGRIRRGQRGAGTAAGQIRRGPRGAAAAAGLAVLTLLVGGAALAGRAGPDYGVAMQVAGRTADDGVFGDIIHTGLGTRGGEWLLYAERFVNAELPDTHVALALGVPGAYGRPNTLVTANETKGSDRSPGFHAVEATMRVGGRTTPTFGYYVGPATRITSSLRARTVTAHLATWSEDPSVVVFWFAPGTRSPKKLAAYGEDGRRLPAGDHGVGVG